jgi:hypothetical protein
MYIYIFILIVSFFVYIYIYLFTENGTHGKRKFVFLARQTINGNQRLLFPQPCPSMLASYWWMCLRKVSLAFSSCPSCSSTRNYITIQRRKQSASGFKSSAFWPWFSSIIRWLKLPDLDTPQLQNRALQDRKGGRIFEISNITITININIMSGSI